MIVLFCFWLCNMLYNNLIRAHSKVSLQGCDGIYKHQVAIKVAAIFSALHY